MKTVTFENQKMWAIPGPGTPTGSESEKLLRLRLQEVEEYNAYLESIIELRMNEMSELMETNSRLSTLISNDLVRPFKYIFGMLKQMKEKVKDRNIADLENSIDNAYYSAKEHLTTLKAI